VERGVVIVPADETVEHPLDIERTWLDWAKIAWLSEGPEAGAAVLAYYVALRDGVTIR
jgi:hypothetical protein